MRRTLMMVLVVAIGALVFAPAAFAQDDNPSGDDLGGDDRGGERAFDDNPTGDDASASPTASATASATSTASASPSATATASAAPGASPGPSVDDGVLPETGGVTPLALAAGILLVGSGIVATMLMRRRTS